MDKKEKRDVGKYSFANGTIQLWSHLPANALGTSSVNQVILRKS
jgi:hypothetical protein